MIAGALERQIRGETLLLLAERALWWPARSLLVVGDTHFGKSSVFARHGIAVPAGPDALDRARLNALLHSTGARRLMILGDFLHGELAPQSAAAGELESWLAGLQPVSVELVTGNHDRSAARGWQGAFDWQGASREEGPFCFTHDLPPEGRMGSGGYLICGHLHPVVAIGAGRKRRGRVPVFWERDDALVLPAFGSFTGGFRVEPDAGGRVFAVAADQVVALPRGRS